MPIAKELKDASLRLVRIQIRSIKILKNYGKVTERKTVIDLRYKSHYLNNNICFMTFLKSCQYWVTYMVSQRMVFKRWIYIIITQILRVVLNGRTKRFLINIFCRFISVSKNNRIRNVLQDICRSDRRDECGGRVAFFVQR